MNIRERIINIIYSAVDDINKMAQKKNRLKKDVDEIISGIRSKFDSVMLINFIICIEEKIEKEFSREISIADEIKKNYEDKSNYSIGSLLKYILEVLQSND